MRPLARDRVRQIQPKREAETKPFPAPRRGWIRNENLAKHKPEGASVLDNWFPTATGCRVRRGTARHATVGGIVSALMSWVSGDTSFMFAANETAIYDVTNPASPTVAPAAALSGLGGGEWASTQFSNEGGSFLVAVNGFDDVQVFDGADWWRNLLKDVATLAAPKTVTLPAGTYTLSIYGTGSVALSGTYSGSLAGTGADNRVSLTFTATAGTLTLTPTGTVGRVYLQAGGTMTHYVAAPGVTTDAVGRFSHIWSFKNRLFFIEKGSMNAWYLPLGAIGGATVKLPLGGIFKRGGSLLFGATWSYESQGGGLNDACVFVTTEGEAAIYEGTDPSSATTWALKGVYRIGRPLGKRAHFKAGGDLAIATDDGLVAISQALARDQAALAQNAISYPIEVEWRKESLQRRSESSWSIEMWPTQQMAIVAMPSYLSLSPISFVVNIRTGAWSRYTGWDTRCLCLLEDRMFFGTSDGRVLEAEVGGTDDGANYTAAFVGLFEDMGAADRVKVSTLARATFRTTQDTGAQMSVSVDYVPTLPIEPSAAPQAAGLSVWGGGIWGQSVWKDTADYTREGRWASVSGVGHTLAPACQITIGQTNAPDIELVSLALMYLTGGMVA